MKLGSCFPWENSSSEPRCHEEHGCSSDEVELSTLQFVGGAKKVNPVGRTGDVLAFSNNLVMERDGCDDGQRENNFCNRKPKKE